MVRCIALVRATRRLGAALATVVALAVAGAPFVSSAAGACDSDVSWGSNFTQPGVANDVYDMKVIGSDVYVGGFFTALADGTSINRIAKWNGSAWSALGAGVDSNVFALAVIGTDLYVAGQFSHAGGA